jgi:hypothetical protein
MERRVSAGTGSSKRASRATLEIVGRPGETVSIQGESLLDMPPSVIFEGRLPLSGRIRLRVPRATLLVVAACGQQAVSFADRESFKSVDVRPVH